MHSSPLELGRKRVKLNVRESFKYFTQELLRKYLKKNICNFKSPISPWRGPQWKLLFWAFFLNSLRNPTTQKISFHWASLLALTDVGETWMMWPWLMKMPNQYLLTMKTCENCKSCPSQIRLKVKPYVSYVCPVSPTQFLACYCLFTRCGNLIT